MQRASLCVMSLHGKHTWAYDPSQMLELEALLAEAITEAVAAEREACVEAVRMCQCERQTDNPISLVHNIVAAIQTRGAAPDQRTQTRMWTVPEFAISEAEIRAWIRRHLGFVAPVSKAEKALVELRVEDMELALAKGLPVPEAYRPLLDLMRGDVSKPGDVDRPADHFGDLGGEG